MDCSRIEVHIKPLLGQRAVGALKLGDIAAGKTSKPRSGSRGGAPAGGKGVAACTMSTLHAVFEHALREAMERYGQPEVFNTDQGVQFTSAAFLAELETRGVWFGRRGTWRHWCVVCILQLLVTTHISLCR